MNPKSEPDDILSAVGRLRHEVQCSLRTRTTAKLSLYFPHKVYNFLFGGKGKRTERRGYSMFSSGDYDPKYFPQGWDMLLDKEGEGLRVGYPVLMRPHLHKSPKMYIQSATGSSFVEAPIHYEAKIFVQFIKIAA